MLLSVVVILAAKVSKTLLVRLNRGADKAMESTDAAGIVADMSESDIPKERARKGFRFRV